VVRDALAKVSRMRSLACDGRVRVVHADMSRVVFDEYWNPLFTMPGFEFFTMTPGEDVAPRVLDQALAVALAGRGWTHDDLHRAVDQCRRGVFPPTLAMLLALEVISDACTGP